MTSCRSGRRRQQLGGHSARPVGVEIVGGDVKCDRPPRDPVRRDVVIAAKTDRARYHPVIYRDHVVGGIADIIAIAGISVGGSSNMT